MHSTKLIDWQLTWFEQDVPNELSVADWRPVTVPGAVQTSPFGLPKDELYRLKNTEKVAWMAEKAWAYRASFEAPQPKADEESVLLFRGVDYLCEVRLNGREVCRHEGMFSHFTVPLTDARPGRNELLVILRPLTTFTQRPAEHLKARFSNGWDWAPKLVTMGIWQDVELVTRPRLRIERAWVQTHLSNAQRADCIIHVRLSEKVDFGHVQVTLAGKSQSYAIVNTETLRLPMRLANPPLWWPNGMGPATLVDLDVRLDVPDRATDPFITRTGLREIRRIPAQGQRPEDTPLQLLINGRKVFIRGANWVPADSCFADVDRDRYALFLRQFADARFNLLRVWGGGLIEKEAFYELADELGLMVMQEFPLACELVPESRRFLEIVDSEARDFIPRLNRHPSIVLWTGGNEHYHYWDDIDSGTPIMQASQLKQWGGKGFVDPRTHMRGSEPYTNLGLNHMAALVDELDGSRPYQPTSGMEGEGEPHGTWNWNPRIGDQRMRDHATLYDFWNAQREHWYSEASVEGIAHHEAIRYVLQDDAPPVPQIGDPVWTFHKAFDTCWKLDRSFFTNPRSGLWLDLASLDELFGQFDRIEDLITASHWLQAEGARYLVEELRRKTPHTVGMIWWGANESWPNLAGNQLIDYFGKARPALHWLANAFRPTIVSIRYHHCVSRAVKGELWISHEGPDEFRGSYRVLLDYLNGGAPPEEYRGNIVCPAYASVFVKTLPYTRLTAGTRLRITCELSNERQERSHRNVYLFASNEDPAPMRPLLPVIGELCTTGLP